MKDAGGRQERERDLDRLLTFVDAIVAIAITLLVLPLVELPARVDDYRSVSSLLTDNADQIYAFLLSFAVVSRFWFAQHHVVRRMLGYDRAVASLLMLWCLTIVFLPFPTGLVAETSNSATTKVLYLGTMMVTTLSMVGVQLVLRRRPGLTEPETDVDPALGIASALTIAVALAITVLVPITGYYPLLLLLVTDRTAGALRAAWKR